MIKSALMFRTRPLTVHVFADDMLHPNFEIQVHVHIKAGLLRKTGKINTLQLSNDILFYCDLMDNYGCLGEFRTALPLAKHHTATPDIDTTLDGNIHVGAGNGLNSSLHQNAII